MPTTICIRGKRASASVFCSNLILLGRTIAYLNAYGPTQEIRCFAQLLMSGDGTLDALNHTTFKVSSMPINLLKLDHGYSAIIVTPPMSTGLVIGDSEDECIATYSRILDQQHFVLRAWYRALYDLSQTIQPLIGTKICRRIVLDVAQEVTQLIKYGCCQFPEPTAHFTLSQEDPHEALSH